MHNLVNLLHQHINIEEIRDIYPVLENDIYRDDAEQITCGINIKTPSVTSS